MKGFSLMARWLSAYWEPGQETGLSRRDRRGGAYRTYLPDPLAGRFVQIGPDLSLQIARAEREVRRLTADREAHALEGIARYLLRSEAIASSMIEGIAPSPQQVALAELAQDEDLRGFSAQAKLVANNITVLRRAAKDLADADSVTVEDVVRLHTALLPEERHHGLRTVQNWIGGSNWHPLDADFVPPPADAVPTLMNDLVQYLNGSAHAAIVQAALVHAQFETIHPFTDGNGRVGRALIHTVLTRRGLTPAAVLPISLVLATLRDEYVDGLVDYRFDGDQLEHAAQAGVDRWLTTFVEATTVAVAQSERLTSDIAELRADWRERLAAHRRGLGRRPFPRADSAVARLLEALPEVPIMTTRTVQRLLGTSFPAAHAALEELAEAGILRRKRVERNTTGYLASDVFDLLGHTERRLASTRFDTRVSPPSRPVPAP